MSKRVILAGLFHETNTFVGGSTPLEAFEMQIGEEVLTARGGDSPMSAALEVAETLGWELLPAIHLNATPSATADDEVVERFWSEFLRVVSGRRPQNVDGVFLVLHGAMVSESFVDVEGEILRRIGTVEALRETPVCGVLDLHANFTDLMGQHSSALIAYRENPHIDAKRVSIEAAHLLGSLMEGGKQPTTVVEHSHLMWPPSGTGTGLRPMLTLENRARSIEVDDPDILAVNVFAGFPFADVPETGVCFSAVTTGDRNAAENRLRGLSELAWSEREAGSALGLSLDEALRKLKQHSDGPVLLVEPSDNVGAGAPGEGTSVLNGFLRYGISDAGVVINDPEVAQFLHSVTLGTEVQISLGGKTGTVGMEPLSLKAELLSLSDGVFDLEDKNSHLAARGSSRIDMGLSAVVRSEGVCVLVTSRRTSPFDLGQWRSQGIDPEELFAINIKAAVGHKRAYDPIASASYTVDVTGPCSEDLTKLPYRNVRRPIYPLDENS